MSTIALAWVPSSICAMSPIEKFDSVQLARGRKETRSVISNRATGLILHSTQETKDLLLPLFIQ